MTLRTQVLIWIGFSIVVILAIWLFRPILLPFVIGIALAYILNPVVTFVQRMGIGRAWASAAVLLSVFGLIIGLFVVQYQGTAAIAVFFGPITLVWFAVMAWGGLVHVMIEVKQLDDLGRCVDRCKKAGTTIAIDREPYTCW